MFDINTVNPKSDQILAVWRADKAAYDATQSEVSLSRSAGRALWRVALRGQGRHATSHALHRLHHGRAAYRLRLSDRRQDGAPRRRGRVLSIRHLYQQSRRPASASLTGYTSSVQRERHRRSLRPASTTSTASTTSGCQTARRPALTRWSIPFPEGLTTAAGPAADCSPISDRVPPAYRCTTRRRAPISTRSACSASCRKA